MKSALPLQTSCQMEAGKFRTLLRRVSNLIGFVLFVAAIWIIAREINQVGWNSLARVFSTMSKTNLGLALFLTPVAYLLLTTYDVLAFRYINHKLERSKIIFAAFVGYGFSNSISMTPSMAARYRFYSHWGLSGGEISKVFFFHYLSTWLGFLAVGGIVFLLEPTPISASAFLTFHERRWIGIGMLALLVGYFFIAEFAKNGIRIKGVSFNPPSTRLLMSQILVATLDWALVGIILYVLLPSGSPISYFGFLSVFLFAQVIQIVSHVPGGIGVFEGTILLLLKNDLPSSAILVSLLVYRVIYTLLPLLLAASAFLIFELKQSSARRKARHNDK